MALGSLCILAWNPWWSCMDTKPCRKLWLIWERSFLEDTVPQWMTKLEKDMVGVHVRMLCIGNRGETESRSVVSNSLWPHGLQSSWNSSGQNIGVGSFSLLQRVFPTQGSNPGLLHCRWILYQLSHKGSPRILEWVTYHFSSGSSQLRNRTWVSYIAGGFFTNWAIREALGNF